MSASPVLRPLSPDDRPLVERLWQLYRHDLSEFRDSFPDGEGLFKAGHLPTFFEDPDRCGYLILGDSGVVGFAMLRGLSGEARLMDEFFVLRGARRQRVGRAAALEVLRKHPGLWEMPFQDANAGAARFWRGVATEVAGAAWTEERRPVPNKPHIAPDVWLTLTV